jgi:hypothetical protein
LPHSPERPPARYPGSGPGQALWALLLARIYEVLPLRCVLCGGEMRIIAFVTDHPAIHSILTYLGEPTAAPAPAQHAARRCGSSPPSPTGMTLQHPYLSTCSTSARAGRPPGPYMCVRRRPPPWG